MVAVVAVGVGVAVAQAERVAAAAVVAAAPAGRVVVAKVAVRASALRSVQTFCAPFPRAADRGAARALAAGKSSAERLWFRAPVAGRKRYVIRCRDAVRSSCRVLAGVRRRCATKGRSSALGHDYDRCLPRQHHR